MILPELGATYEEKGGRVAGCECLQLILHVSFSLPQQPVLPRHLITSVVSKLDQLAVC